MKKTPPRIVSIRDVRGNDLTPPRLAQEWAEERIDPAPTVREELAAAPAGLNEPLPDTGPISRAANLGIAAPSLGFGRLLIAGFSFTLGLLAGLIVMK